MPWSRWRKWSETRLSSGSRRVWMIFARGKIVLISPMWRKLSGRLSVTNASFLKRKGQAGPIELPPVVDGRCVGLRRPFRIIGNARDDRRDEVELARRRHLAVAGQNLLGQRRSGSEHAANEHRRGSGGAVVRWPVKARDQPVDQAFLGLAVIDRPGAAGRAAGDVGGDGGLECLGRTRPPRRAARQARSRARRAGSR